MVVQVKENQKDLLWTGETYASDGTVDDRYKGPIEKHHGRVERRSVEVFKNFTALYPEKWGGLMAEVVKVNRERSVFSTKKKEWVSSDEVSFYVSTTSYNANKYAKIIRSHWAVENSCHYVRDHIFNEDSSRIRINPMNMGILRSFALNICRMKAKNGISNALFENALDFNQAVAFTEATI